METEGSGAYHGEDDGEIIPPKRVDDPHSSIDAGEKDEDDDCEEEARKSIDGDTPSALVVVRRHGAHCSRFRLSCDQRCFRLRGVAMPVV